MPIYSIQKSQFNRRNDYNIAWQGGDFTPNAPAKARRKWKLIYPCQSQTLISSSVLEFKSNLGGEHIICMYSVLYIHQVQLYRTICTIAADAIYRKLLQNPDNDVCKTRNSSFCNWDSKLTDAFGGDIFLSILPRRFPSSCSLIYVIHWVLCTLGVMWHYYIDCVVTVSILIYD